MRLGTHFQNVGLSFTHLFSSHLQRAATTASEIREAQLRRMKDDIVDVRVPDVVQLPVLMEQDFGSMEGKKWSDRSQVPNLANKKHHRQVQTGTAEFVDVESKDAMARRADAFLDEHFLPLFNSSYKCVDLAVAIVSHGIFLSTLWKRLLLRLPAKSVRLPTGVQASARPSLEHLGGWSNTGYLELHLTQTTGEASQLSAVALPPSLMKDFTLTSGILATNTSTDQAEVPPVATNQRFDAQSALERPSATATVAARSTSLRIAHGWTTTILAINCKDHLKGFKRTRGGVGSSRHDASQKNIDAFFKRRKDG